MDRKELYEKTKNELLEKQMSNSETYDKALLSLSSAFLGLSITFTKDIVPINEAICTSLIYYSWVLFAFTIIITISSFIYGQKAIPKLIVAARQFYIDENDGAYKVSETHSKRIELFNTTSGITFICAILLTITFVLTNSSRTQNMPVDNVEEKSQPIAPFEKPQNEEQSSTEDNNEQQSNTKDSS